MYGYSIGHVGQAITYGFVTTYLVVFFTDGVGLSPSVASTISALALLVEVAMGMIVGNLSDNCTSKMGRRRPFMLAAAITMVPIMGFLFHIFDFNSTLKVIYYLFFAILFRLSFVSWEITNAAFGAEIALGYDERTKLRTISRIFSITGNGIAYLLPVYFLDMFDSKALAWQIIGLSIAIVGSLSWFTSVFVNRGKGIYLTEKLEIQKGNRLFAIGKNYLELLKLKAARTVVLYKVAFTCAYALSNVCMMYYLQYSAGLSTNYKTYVYFASIAIQVIMIPIASKMAMKLGKAMQQAYMMIFSGVLGIIIYFAFPSTFFGAISYFAIFTIAQTSFWQLSNAVFYDIIEVDEWVNNKRREGDMSSLVSVIGTFISSLVVWGFGIIFDIVGYDASLAVQSKEVVSFLNGSFILVPSLFYIVCFIALKSCPINKKTFGSLQAAIKCRKEGKDYSIYMDDINKILG